MKVGSLNKARTTFKKVALNGYHNITGYFAAFLVRDYRQISINLLVAQEVEHVAPKPPALGLIPST